MKDFHELLKKIGIINTNDDLYIEALTHPSYQNEVDPNHGNYQRLEFLGDAVLELMVSRYIYFSFPEMDEGNMTLLRSALVREESLFDMAKYINLGSYIRLGKGETANKGYERPSLVSDVFEALLAAIYFDLGFEAAEKHVNKYVGKYIEEKGIEEILASLKDPKTRLQEKVQADSKRSVSYKLVKQSDPREPSHFEVEVYMDDILYGFGTGSSKQQAEENAAADALSKMVK